MTRSSSTGPNRVPQGACLNPVSEPGCFHAMHRASQWCFGSPCGVTRTVFYDSPVTRQLDITCERVP
ncbi:hypothetical protein Hypma_003982 [Hypsizygus marmoreus]|uniref:Uncharacterized protein n=1 Tax=Hypsizygus marmoreus TaxID=39966 RepID=A0A369J111_HYPMA|nr:hypothetical protein Hypma_003982 [Hypsizygus marmoreus]